MRGAADKHTCKLPAFTATAGGCIPTALTGGLSPFPSRVCWRPNNLKDRPFPAGRCRSSLPNPVTFLARAARQEDGYTRSGPLLGVGIPPAMEVSSEPLSADVMIIKKEAELQSIWEDLALEASGRATLGKELEKPDWSAAEEAQLKASWMGSWAHESSLREDKTYVMDVLRGLRRVVDVDEYAANLPLAAAMMKRRTLSNVINKKEKQLEVVRGNLKATSKELADARQKLQQLPPRADRAHCQHIVDATVGVLESFREDKTYILAELRGLHMKFSELEAAIKRAMQVRSHPLFVYFCVPHFVLSLYLTLCSSFACVVLCVHVLFYADMRYSTCLRFFLCSGSTYCGHIRSSAARRRYTPRPSTR